MRVATHILIFFSLFAFSFTRIEFPEKLSKTNIAQLKEGDSLVFYQCYCFDILEPTKVLDKDSLMGRNSKNLRTKTEKFILSKKGGGYRIKMFKSDYTNFPNAKFAYLKLVEKDYWKFELAKDTLISDRSVLELASLELLLHPITEYDFKVTEKNFPQIIINGKKISEQKIAVGSYLIGKIIPELKEKN